MKIPLQKIVDPLISSFGINLFILRLDQVHPLVTGNKFFKLKYNLQEAKRLGKDTLVTFGGAFSNHIAAVAAAGKEFGFKTIGIIRGEELQTSPPTPLLRERGANNTLRFAEACGMKLHFVSREDYRKLCDTPTHLLIHSLTPIFPYSPSHYLLPEGGTNNLAVKGCAEILTLIDIPFDYVCCPVGTGGTIAGVVSSLKENQKAIGFSVLKAPGYLQTEVKNLLTDFSASTFSNFQINEDFHFGGYAKHTPELLNFISDFEVNNQIPLDQVYTGKMMFGIYDCIKRGILNEILL